MKGHKLLLSLIGIFVTLVAVVTVVIIFKNEIVDFFVALKDKFDEKRAGGEFSDYADM